MLRAAGLDLLVGDFNRVEGPADKTGMWRPTPSVRELAVLLDTVDTQEVGSTHTSGPQLFRVGTESSLLV